MSSTVRPNRINIDLQGYKQQWLDYCKANNVTPSEAFRQIVAKLTTPRAPVAGFTGATDDAKIRREVRLTASEVAQAEAIAHQEGFSLSRWIVALINARLQATAQLGQQELEILARSNQQLLAIGRNLNQLARIANGNSAQAVCEKEDIETLRIFVSDHARRVAAVLSANVKRWSM